MISFFESKQNLYVRGANRNASKEIETRVCWASNGLNFQGSNCWTMILGLFFILLLSPRICRCIQNGTLALRGRDDEHFRHFVALAQISEHGEPFCGGTIVTEKWGCVSRTLSSNSS